MRKGVHTLLLEFRDPGGDTLAATGRLETNPMGFNFVRTLRTPSSERFLLQCGKAQDAAVLELHYTASGSVVGTLLILDSELQNDATTQDLLQFIDDSLLPMASLNEESLSFTVVHGKVAGQFENEQH